MSHSSAALKIEPDHEAIKVTPDNFARAESDLIFGGIIQEAGGLGKMFHHREAIKPGYMVVRPNRDTLYSGGIFDLEAGPLTITIPDSGKRFMSLMVVNQDHYCLAVHYTPGSHAFTRQQVGTRYLMLAVRIFVDPNDPDDVKQVHALQDMIKTSQPGGPEKFEVQDWDKASQDKVRAALKMLGETQTDSRGGFGRKGEVDPTRHLILTAIGYGGTPEKDATYLSITPDRNDGKTAYELKVKDVPVDAFWSATVYDQEGSFIDNKYDAYSFNNITAARETDGSVVIHFGGDDKATNFIPIQAGWNYSVRLYRPRPEILNGTWKFPEATPTKGE